MEGPDPGEDEADEDHDVEQALHHDGAHHRKPRDAIAPPEEIGAHQFPQPRGQEIIRRIAHQEPIQDLAEAEPAHRGQQDAPAPAPQHEGHPVGCDGGCEPARTDLRQLGAEPGDIDAGDGKPEEGDPDRKADCDLEQAMAQDLHWGRIRGRGRDSVNAPRGLARAAAAIPG